MICADNNVGKRIEEHFKFIIYKKVKVCVNWEVICTSYVYILWAFGKFLILLLFFLLPDDPSLTKSLVSLLHSITFQSKASAGLVRASARFMINFVSVFNPINSIPTLLMLIGWELLCMTTNFLKQLFAPNSSDSLYLFSFYIFTWNFELWEVNYILLGDERLSKSWEFYKRTQHNDLARVYPEPFNPESSPIITSLRSPPPPLPRPNNAYINFTPPQVKWHSSMHSGSSKRVLHIYVLML